MKPSTRSCSGTSFLALRLRQNKARNSVFCSGFCPLAHIRLRVVHVLSSSNQDHKVRAPSCVPVKKKSRFTSRRHPQKGKNRATTSQSSSRHWSAALPEAQAGSDGRSGPADREDLWVAEKTSLSRQQDVVAWSPRMVAPSDARLLELADIALGLRKPETFRRRRSAVLSANRSSVSRS